MIRSQALKGGTQHPSRVTGEEKSSSNAARERGPQSGLELAGRIEHTPEEKLLRDVIPRKEA